MKEIEIWLPVVGFEFTYRVSNLGRVRRLRHHIVRKDGIRTLMRAKIMRPTPDSKNYLQVSVGGKLRSVHRLVATAFIGPRPKGFTTCHNDGNERNNRALNLRYDTYKANAEDRKKHGTELIGSKRATAKLNEETAVIALRRALAGESKASIARDFGVAPSTISVLVSRKTWTHIHV